MDERSSPPWSGDCDARSPARWHASPQRLCDPTQTRPQAPRTWCACSCASRACLRLHTCPHPPPSPREPASTHHACAGTHTARVPHLSHIHSAASAGDVFHSALNMKEGPLRRQHQLGHPRRFRRCCYLPQPHTDAAAEQKNRATWQMQGTGRGRRDPNLVGGWKRARGHARGRRCGGPGRMGGACRVAHLNEHASGAIE